MSCSAWPSMTSISSAGTFTLKCSSNMSVLGIVVFAPLKNRKVRDVPIADEVLPVLSEHVKAHPPVRVTLPWLVPSGSR